MHTEIVPGPGNSEDTDGDLRPGTWHCDHRVRGHRRRRRGATGFPGPGYAVSLIAVDLCEQRVAFATSWTHDQLRHPKRPRKGPGSCSDHPDFRRGIHAA
jgi:hypothetical protein